MAISTYINDTMKSKGAGVIRKMFEEGIKLKAQYGADKVYDFSLGNPDLTPPKKVEKAFKRLASSKEANYHGYMPNAGFDFARQAMADKTSLEQGVNVTKDCIIMEVGAAGAINVLLKAIMNPGDNVIVPAPYFTEYGHYVKNAGGNLLPAQSNEDFSLNISNIEKLLDEKTAAVLINSPNNPTGRVYTEDEIKKLTELLEKKAGETGRKPYLILDEPYRAITYEGIKVAAAFPLYDSSVVVTSFAKNLSLPGERIGYIAVNPACPDKVDLVAACIFCTRILGFVNAPAVQQRVVAETWNAPVDYSLYEKRRNEITAIMDEAGIEYAKPYGAFYLWCKAPDCFNGDDMAFCDHLKKYNILCAPGSGFCGKGWIRLAYCASEKTILSSRAAFIKAMADLKK